MDDREQRKAEWSVDRFFYSLLLICAYSIAVVVLKLVLFEALVKVPKHVWVSVYWYVAGAIFALYVVPKIRKWYNREY